MQVFKTQLSNYKLVPRTSAILCLTREHFLRGPWKAQRKQMLSESTIYINWIVLPPVSSNKGRDAASISNNLCYISSSPNLFNYTQTLQYVDMPNLILIHMLLLFVFFQLQSSLTYRYRWQSWKWGLKPVSCRLIFSFRWFHRLASYFPPS
jgi:hypothetical protein